MNHDSGSHFASGSDAPSKLYARLTEPELMHLARDYDSLTEPAQAALRDEFARRHLQPPLIQENDRATSRRLITVRRYRDLSEAIVARSLLESAGIVVYLRDENLIRLDWQISNFIGGLRLQVEDKDESAALELLAQPVPEEIHFSALAGYEQPRCPVCDSLDITFEGPGRGAALASLYLLAIPLAPGPETWLCATCGARWQDPDTSTTG